MVFKIFEKFRPVEQPIEGADVNLEERLGPLPASDGKADSRKSLIPAPKTEAAPERRKSNLEIAIEEGTLRPVDRTKSKS